jgi:hypothetical protein
LVLRRRWRLIGIVLALVAVGVAAVAVLAHGPPADKYATFNSHLREAGVIAKNVDSDNVVNSNPDERSMNASTYLGNKVCGNLKDGLSREAVAKKIQLQHMLSPSASRQVVTLAIADLCPIDGR